MVEKILLAEPRGFCAGVERAIRIVEEALKEYGTVYVRHQIVHNQHVVEELEQKGAVFIESLEEVPEKSTIVFSAHGTPPTVFKDAEKKQLNVIDAACPLVKKVHMEARRYAEQGYDIVLIGHKGHQEVIGTTGYAKMSVIQNARDISELELGPKAAYLTQTTLSVDQTKDIIAELKTRFPYIKGPAKDDICYATTNRQRAVQEIAGECDLLLVIGAENSSNTRRLAETGSRAGVETYRINDNSEIETAWLENRIIGITSGASVPEKIVESVIEYIKEQHPQVRAERRVYIDENTKFNLPVIKKER